MVIVPPGPLVQNIADLYEWTSGRLQQRWPPSSTASSGAGLGLLLVCGLFLVHLKLHVLKVV